MEKLREFTTAELAAYDGKEGRPAYIGYEGKVYDVTQSKLWRNGVHVRQHSAGNELTKEMAGAPHTDAVMEGISIVGVLVEAKPARELPEPPPLIAWLLDRHPHPVTVHFPIALGVVAALLAFVALFMGQSAERAFVERAAFYNLVICGLGTPVAIASGLLSWYYNYGMAWTRIYKWKVWLSVALVFLSALTLSVRLLGMEDGAQGGPAYLAYVALTLAHGPLVLWLGWWGGKISFPN